MDDNAHIPVDDLELEDYEAANAEAEEHARLEDFRQWRDEAGYSLLDAETSAPIPWVPGATRIIKKGERQSWVAREGEGKTQAAMHLVAQVCEAGGRVMYVDVENDRVEMAERQQPIAKGLEVEEAVRERLAYLPDVNLRSVMDAPDLKASFVRAIMHVDLLIIDSWTRVLNQFGYSEDSNQEVTSFVDEIVTPLARAGIAVLILDNTGKQGKEARGAVSKRALIESVYNVTGGKGVKPPNPEDPTDIGKHGTLKLDLDRSRSGKLADHLEAGSGGGNFERLHEAQKVRASSNGKAQEAVTAEMLLLKPLFRDHPDTAYDYRTAAELTGIGVKTVERRVKELAEDGWVERDERPGTKHYWKFSRQSTS